MSVKAIAWVWEHSRAEGAARLVLLAIADCANATGWDAWPSMAELCRKTRLSERGVQKAIRRLEEMGELMVTVNSGRGRTNRYRVVMETPNGVRGSEVVNPEPGAPRTEFAPEPGSPQTPNVVRETPNHVHPEPSEPTTGTVTERGAREAVDAPRAAGHERPAGLTAIPDGFSVTDSMRRWAVATFGERLDVNFETAQFISHYRSTGASRRSWPDAWQKWMRDSDRRLTERSARSAAVGDRRQQQTNDLFGRAMVRAAEREDLS